MHEIERSVVISAPAAHVWDVLVDFRRYPEWNPFVTAAEGRPLPGARLRLRLCPPGGRPMTFRPHVLAVVPGHELQWAGRLPVAGLFDSESRFVLTAIGPGHCRLTQHETFGGLLVPLFADGFRAAADVFDAMNQALKARVEHLVGDREAPATAWRLGA